MAALLYRYGTVRVVALAPVRGQPLQVAPPVSVVPARQGRPSGRLRPDCMPVGSVDPTVHAHRLRRGSEAANNSSLEV